MIKHDLFFCTCAIVTGKKRCNAHLKPIYICIYKTKCKMNRLFVVKLINLLKIKLLDAQEEVS